MHFSRRGLLVIGLVCACGNTYAQTEHEVLVERLTELLAEDMTEDFDYSEWVERLDFYQRHPIDLNKTDGRELRELQFVPQLFINNLLDHRHRTGRFVAIQEIQAIVGMDVESMRLLLPYITVNAPSSLSAVRLRKLAHDGDHDLMLRYGRTLQQRRGYAIADTTRSRYLGSPDQLFARYRYHFAKDLQLSINMKKDAGESFFAGAQRYGFDFYSGSLYLRNQGVVKDVVVGDYALQFGQGLALWNGLGFGKGSMVQGIAKQATGLRPYTSANEVLFLRGAAATVAMGRFSITPFASWRRLDGGVTMTADDTEVVASIGQTGLHRTPGEVANRGAVQQAVYGINTQYRFGRLRVGTLAYHTRFDATVSPQPLLRNRYAFRGNALWNTSVHYDYSFKGIYVFGEGAHQVGGGYAFLNGALASLHPHLSLSLLHRDYRRDYHSFFSQGLAEGSGVANERGFYSGLVYHPSRAVEWMAYADVFRFPWLRYRVDAPSRGMDMLSQFSYTWYKRGQVSIRYRYRHREENAAMEGPHHLVAGVSRQQVRLGGEYRLDGTWRVRGRIELMHYQKEAGATELGWMVYQDVFWKPAGSRLSGNGRLAVFGTPGYDSRIYAFENDVLYAYSFPVYHGKGIRAYANARCRIGRTMDIWVRYATFVYRGIDELGSGLDLIEGNRRSDVRVQFRAQF